MQFQPNCPFECVLKVPCTYPGVYPNMYEVSNDGRVFNIVSGNEIKIGSNYQGYQQCKIKMINGFWTSIKLHRLVAWEFCNPLANYAELTVNHIDGDKHNNMYWNLEWCTYSYNAKDAWVRGVMPIGETAYRAKLTNQQVHQICQLLENSYRTIQSIADEIGTTYEIVRGIARGHTWKHISSQYNILPRRSKFNQHITS